LNIQDIVRALQKNRYDVTVFATASEAADYLDRQIDGKRVGFGDSLTLKGMHMYERLARHNEVADPQRTLDLASFMDIAKRALMTDVFLTSVNAMTEQGEMVNMDGTGNRVAGSLFGHEKVYFVVGTNKIVPTLDDAIHRVRNVAAPLNAKRHGKKTPCAIHGDRCYDCSSPERICNALVIHLKKMSHCPTEVVLIDEKLGY
jgi:NAD-dependent dihydropyrimidine dehydrogenase PreA subunit